MEEFPSCQTCEDYQNATVNPAVCHCEDCGGIYVCETCDNEIHRHEELRGHLRFPVADRARVEVALRNLKPSTSAPATTDQEALSTVAATVDYTKDAMPVVLTQYCENVIASPSEELAEASSLMTFVSFVGPSGAGKSSLICMLNELMCLPQPMPPGLRLPVRGHAGTHVSTTSDLHIFRGPEIQSNGNLARVMYMDSEGIYGSKVPLMIRKIVDTFTPDRLATFTAKRSSHVHTTYPRLCLSFSDVVCFVSERSWRSKGEVMTPLLDWARSAGAGIFNQLLKPHLIIIYNRQPLSDFGDNSGNIRPDHTTRVFFDPCLELRQELDQYFASITVLVIPDASSTLVSERLLAQQCICLVDRIKVCIGANLSLSSANGLHRRPEWYVEMFHRALLRFNSNQPLNLLAEGLVAEGSRLARNLQAHWETLSTRFGYDEAIARMNDRLSVLPSLLALRRTGVHAAAVGGDTSHINLPPEWEQICNQLALLINSSAPCKATCSFRCERNTVVVAQCRTSRSAHGSGHQSDTVHYRRSERLSEWIRSRDGIVEVACRWEGTFDSAAQGEITNLGIQQIVEDGLRQQVLQQRDLRSVCADFVQRECQPNDGKRIITTPYCLFCLENDALDYLDDCGHCLCEECIDQMKDDAARREGDPTYYCPCCRQSLRMHDGPEEFNKLPQGGIRILVEYAGRSVDVVARDKFDLIVTMKSNSKVALALQQEIKTDQFYEDTQTYLTTTLFFGMALAFNPIISYATGVVAGVSVSAIMLVRRAGIEDTVELSFHDENKRSGFRSLRGVSISNGKEDATYFIVSRPDSKLPKPVADLESLFEGCYLKGSFYELIAKRLWPHRTIDAVVYANVGRDGCFFARKKQDLTTPRFIPVVGPNRSIFECFFLKPLLGTEDQWSFDVVNKKIQFHMCRKCPEEALQLDTMGGLADGATRFLFQAFNFTTTKLLIQVVCDKDQSIKGTITTVEYGPLAWVRDDNNHKLLRLRDAITINIDPTKISHESRTVFLSCKLVLPSITCHISGSPYKIFLHHLAPTSLSGLSEGSETSAAK